ncbi:hypothetical protein VTJ49DRAFT_6263 [Mycothermus thermophilus]|uniref:Uncharacterized protein n=1 Tax=Humicola insolens TaxID=85995 RepID=A0ABR3V1I9_HUMIN
MRSPAPIISLVGGLAATALAQDAIATCELDGWSSCLPPSASLKTRDFSHMTLTGLFRRQSVDECPEEDKLCSGGLQPPELTPITLPLVCGKKPTSNSVTVSYGICPTQATWCIIFDLDGTGLEQPKLQISANPLADATTFEYNEYCSDKQCAVPIQVLTRNLGLTALADFCAAQPLWVALQSGVNGETCWADGEPIAPKKVKRTKCKPDPQTEAMQFPVSFDCPVLPTVCCCCRQATTEPPKVCSAGVWAAPSDSASELKELGCTDGPGFYAPLPAEEASAGVLFHMRKILADGDYEPVGLAQITINSDDTGESACATVIVGLTSVAHLLSVNRVRVHITCEDPATALGSSCADPSVYSIDSGCLVGNVQSTHLVQSCEVPSCPDVYYAIVYTDANEAFQDESTAPEVCPAPVCTEAEE